MGSFSLVQKALNSKMTQKFQFEV